MYLIFTTQILTAIIIMSIVDYKNENFDDGDLQSRLYAEIYYESNVEAGSKTSDISRTIQLANMDAESNLEPENMQQQSEDRQPLESESARDKSSKTKKISREHCNQNTPLPNESSVIDSDILRVQNSADAIDPASVEIQTNTDKLSGREINPVIHDNDNINNDNPGNSSVEKEKKCKESVAKKHKSFNHTKSKHQESFLKDQTASPNDTIRSKCNVMLKSVKHEIFLEKQLKKNKQTSDSSDSDESIFEVPVPPKPKPPLINLQDSDEENHTNSRMDDLISEKVIPATSKITGRSSNHQDTSVNNKSTDKSLHNKDTTVNSRSMQEIREDIVLNCTIVQKGAKSINEIKQSSKTAKLNKSQGDVSIEDTNQNSTKQLSQNTSKQHNTNLELFMIPEIYSYSHIHKSQRNVDKSNIIPTHGRYNLRSAEKNNPLDATASCSSNDTAIDRKRQNDSTIESSKEKRQCIVQQNNQNVMQQSSSGGERRKESRNEHFKTMSDSLRNYYYNSSRGQENFDVGELQRGMSRDPRMWRIMDEDLMPSPPSRQRNRFWNVRCTNCHQDGHQRYDCPVPRKTPCCYICGNKGHVESRCPQKICLTCGKQQNTFRKTCEYCRVLYCTMCHSVGHESTQCPDLWRRYHQTTDMSSAPQDPGNIMKPSGLLHCCNCTKRGHESSMCNAYRWSQHFQTPAAVTNYTDGPMYTYATSFSNSDFQISLSSRATSSSSSIPMEEYSKSTRVDALSSSAKANETPIPQKTLCNLEVEGNLESSPMINKIHRPEDKQKYRQNGIIENEFTTILFIYGEFHDKNNKDAKIFSRNLSSIKKLTSYGKRTVRNLSKREIAPIFLKALSEKAIEFEVKIGYTKMDQCQDIILQIIAMKEYVKLIQNLLLHWIDLPDNEKDYGMDMTLPMNPTKMFNLLSSRMPQLTKMSFTCYNDHIKGINDPRWISHSIKNHKRLLEQHNGSFRQYSRLRTKMWRLQVKLLMIFNTEPKPNCYIRDFKKVMKQLESVKQDQMIEKLDTAIYLKLTLLYNRLFVPHTPVGIIYMLQRIEKHSKMMLTNMNCSPQIMQELENDEMCEENLASDFNVNSSLTVTFNTSQNINSAEDLSPINIQQNTNEEMFVERRDDISPIINDTIDCDDNEIMILEDSVTEDAQTTTSSNTEIFNYIEPVLISTEDINDSQPLTSGLNIECNTSTDKQNVKKNPTKQDKRTKKQQRLERRRNIAIQNMYPDASKLIKEARELEIPYMMNAANELEKKFNSRTIMLHHVDTMKKMIKLEKKYRKNVSTFKI